MDQVNGIVQNTPRWRGLVPIMPLTHDHYRRMTAAGVIASDDPVELRDGYLVAKGRARPGRCETHTNPPRLGNGQELWPLSLDQFRRMYELGILHPDDRVEMLEGFLVLTDRGGGPGMGAGPLHALATGRVNRLLIKHLPEEWVVRCQDPIRLGLGNLPGAGSEPVPDLAVAQGPDTLYAGQHPGPADLRLVAEVADTSLVADRRAKAALYAAHGIALYWIVNLVDRCLEIYTDPDPAAGQYRSQQVLAEDQQVVLSWSGLAPVTFTVRDFLP